MVFVCLDLMSLAHKGFSASVDRCHDKGNLRLMAIFFMLVLRLATVVFTATACLYVTEPGAIALAGLGAICIQLLIRIMGNFFFPSHHEAHAHEGAGDDNGHDGSMTKQTTIPEWTNNPTNGSSH